jgi:hypothetical protein
MGNAWAAFTNLHPATISWIVVGSVVFIFGLIILTLWLAGVFPSDDGTTIIVVPTGSDVEPIVTVTVSTSPAGPVDCPTDGTFLLASSLPGPSAEPVFGNPVTTTTSGEFAATFSTTSNADDGGFSRIYQRNGDTYSLFDSADFSLPPGSKLFGATISGLGNHVASGITDGAQSSVRMTRRSGSDFFTSPQDIMDVTYNMSGITYFPEPVNAQDTVMFVTFLDASNNGIVKEYRFDGGTWILKQSLTAPVVGVGDRFGVRYSQQGNILAITQAVPGGVRMYSRTDASTDWVHEPSLDIPAPAAADNGFFGTAMTMSLDGLNLYVSNITVTVDTKTNAGQVFGYRRADITSPFTLTETLCPQASLLDNSAFYGLDLIMYGNTLAVAGSYRATVNKITEIRSVDLTTGTSMVTDSVPWPTVGGPLVEGGPGLTMFVSGTSAGSETFNNLYLVVGTPNILTQDGALSLYKSACR